MGELPQGASEIQVQFWAAQLQEAVAIFLEPCCPDEHCMPDVAPPPNVRPSVRDLTLPDGTVVHSLPTPFLDRESELALRLVCHNSRSALAGINPAWRPIWQWCSAIGYCVAPSPSRELRAAIGAALPCRCGLPVRAGRSELPSGGSTASNWCHFLDTIPRPVD